MLKADVYAFMPNMKQQWQSCHIMILLQDKNAHLFKEALLCILERIVNHIVIIFEYNMLYK